MKKKFNGEIYFTPKQAAEYFNLSLSTIKNYIYASKLKTLKTPGGHHRIRKSELLATLGDMAELSSDAHSLSLKFGLCTAMLTLFKSLGPNGGSMVMHAKRVAVLCVDAARTMAMSEPDIKRLEMAALVHDIGHTGMDRRIVLKPGTLSPQEYDLIKLHPQIGGELLNSTKWLKGVADIVIEHHERIDGSGYPKGLSGENIQKASRLISIAEAYDSMISESYYRRAVSKDTAVSELVRNKGSQFDPDIVEIFINVI